MVILGCTSIGEKVLRGSNVNTSRIGKKVIPAAGRCYKEESIAMEAVEQHATQVVKVLK